MNNKNSPKKDYNYDEAKANVNAGVDLSFERDNNVGYEGRDGWMYREQSALEQDIEEAKRVYEDKLRAKSKIDEQKMIEMRAQQKARQAESDRQQHRNYVQNNVSGYGGGGGGGGGGVWEAKRSEAVKNRQYEQNNDWRQQQQQQQQQLVQQSHHSYNGGQFANPTAEWGWSRAQAERNRLRAENDRNPPARVDNNNNNNNNNEYNAMKANIGEMHAKEESERQNQRQQQARNEYFQNRQIAAAAKARYNYEEVGNEDGDNKNNNVNRGRRSSINEVRQSANLQKEVQEARKKQEFDDAYKLMQAERAALAEKLRQRNVEEESKFADGNDDDSIEEEKQSKEQYDDEIVNEVEEEEEEKYSEEVNELARALEQAADDDDDDDDDDDEVSTYKWRASEAKADFVIRFTVWRASEAKADSVIRFTVQGFCFFAMCRFLGSLQKRSKRSSNSVVHCCAVEGAKRRA